MFTMSGCGSHNGFLPDRPLSQTVTVATISGTIRQADSRCPSNFSQMLARRIRAMKLRREYQAIPLSYPCCCP
jgi:hypothetical protein